MSDLYLRLIVARIILRCLISPFVGMSKIKLIFSFTLFLLFWCWGADGVMAAPGINRKMNFQGKVVNKGTLDGTNVTDGPYDFQFSIWSTLTVGTSIWTEVWNSGTTQVTVTDGIFGVALGTYATFPPEIDFNSDNIYLSVNFESDGDMAPRIQFMAVPYAFNAERVAGLTVTNTTGTLTIPDGKTITFGESFTTTGVGITLNQSLSTSDTVSFASLGLTGLSTGVGSTVLYIDGSGNIVSGTLPTVNLANSKVIVLSPEYLGASLSADGSGTTAVAMTSDNTLNSGGVGWKNYYQLTSSEATLQDYSVLVRVTLPSDFDTWETGSCPGTTCALEINYQTGLVTTADNFISAIVSNDSDTPATAVCTIGSTASTSWGASGCASTVLNDGGAPEWDASGETAVIRLKLGAKNTASALVRAGDIILRYKSKF